MEWFRSGRSGFWWNWDSSKAHGGRTNTEPIHEGREASVSRVRDVSGVRFIYIPCSEQPAMRRFYTNLLGLDEIYHSEEDRSVVYDCDGLQFSIYETE